MQRTLQKPSAALKPHVAATSSVTWGSKWGTSLRCCVFGGQQVSGASGMMFLLGNLSYSRHSSALKWLPESPCHGALEARAGPAIAAAMAGAAFSVQRALEGKTSPPPPPYPHLPYSGLHTLSTPKALNELAMALGAAEGPCLPMHVQDSLVYCEIFRAWSILCSWNKKTMASNPADWLEQQLKEIPNNSTTWSWMKEMNFTFSFPHLWPIYFIQLKSLSSLTILQCL